MGALYLPFHPILYSHLFVNHFLMVAWQIFFLPLLALSHSNYSRLRSLASVLSDEWLFAFKDVKGSNKVFPGTSGEG